MGSTAVTAQHTAQHTGQNRTRTRQQQEMALTNTNSWLNTLATRSWGGEEAPSFELIENDDGWVLSSNVPVPHEKIEIEVKDDHIEISGSNHKTKTTEENGWTCTSSSSASFFRRLPLPEGVDPSSIETTNQDGVLTITMPKS